MVGRDKLRIVILKMIQDQANQRKTFHPASEIYREGPIDHALKREGLGPLSEAELLDASLVFSEIERAGFIALVPTQGGWNRWTITPAGEEFLKAQGKRKFFKVPVRDVVSDLEILEKTESVLANGDLDTAVFAAFKVVEERLRRVAGLDAKAFGVDLVNQAFNPKTGRLIYMHAKTESEHEAIFSLFRGAVGAFKNPASHRTVAYDHQQHALQTIALADLLLRYIDQTTVRQPTATP
jgi:uncharacterized protein (TIGR02391 family)